MDSNEYDEIPESGEVAPNPSTPGESRAWVADEAVANLAMERSVNPSETPEELSRRLIQENLPAATASVVHMAIHSPNERLRLDASKYVMDRALGKIGDDKPVDGKDPWTTLLDKIIKEETGAGVTTAPTPGTTGTGA